MPWTDRHGNHHSKKYPKRSYLHIFVDTNFNECWGRDTVKEDEKSEFKGIGLCKIDTFCSLCKTIGHSILGTEGIYS